MKLNLSIEGDDYKDKVNQLKEELDQCRETGVLPADFEKQLTDLVEIEQTLLKEMLPYYRIREESKQKTSLEITPIKALGAYRFDSILQSMFRINEHLFILSGIDRKVQFFYLSTPDHYSTKDQVKIEWGEKLKTINERITFIDKLNDHELLLLGVQGGAYMISSQDFNKLPNTHTDIEVSKLKINHSPAQFSGYGSVLTLEENLFVTHDGKDKLLLFELKRADHKYWIDFHQEISYPIANFTVMEKVSDHQFVVGTKDGKMYRLEYADHQFKRLKEVHVFQDKIRELRNLEDGNGDNSSLMVIGNNGHLKVYSQNGNVILEQTGLSGHLFDLQSEGGRALVLSEDGVIYLFEENFGHWCLKKDTKIEGIFFNHVAKLDRLKYLLIDIKGEVSLLSINGIYTPQDLWSIPLYE